MGREGVQGGGKTFIFLRAHAAGLGFSLKLPVSRDFALAFDFAQPTGYRLGRSGWVTFDIAPASDADPDLLLRFLDESWRAVAPKWLSAAHSPT